MIKDIETVAKFAALVVQIKMMVEVEEVVVQRKITVQVVVMEIKSTVEVEVKCYCYCHCHLALVYCLVSLIYFWAIVYTWRSRCFLISSLARSFFPTSMCLRSEPTIGFSASNVDTASKTNSRGFCLLIIFLLIGCNFCQKLALLILSFVT